MNVSESSGAGSSDEELKAEYEEQRYNFLLQYYEDLGDRQRELRLKQDQLVITLSVATLGFSVGFVKDIVLLGNAEFEILLFMSWVVLIFSAAAVIVAISAGTLAHEKNMDIVYDALDKWDDSNRDIDYLANKDLSGWKSKLSYWSHYLSPALLLLGIIFNTLFVGLNYSNVPQNVIATPPVKTTIK